MTELDHADVESFKSSGLALWLVILNRVSTMHGNRGKPHISIIIGRTLPKFTLPKYLATTLAAGYSIPMRHSIVKR
jgi:hypothetical protein